MPKVINLETQGGQPISAGNFTLTPFAQSLRIRIPGLRGGLVWNRPISILVTGADGQEQVIPVPDVTRQVQWGLLGGGLAGSLLLWLIFQRNRKT